MTTSAISSWGTLLKIGDGETSETFTTIAEVLDISGPKLSADREDATSHDSTDGWEEKIVTILKGGEVTFDINYIPTGATHSATAGLLDDFENRTLRNFKIVFPDGSSTTWTFSAFVVGFEPGAPVKGKLKGSVTLDISGKPTLA